MSSVGSSTPLPVPQEHCLSRQDSKVPERKSGVKTVYPRSQVLQSLMVPLVPSHIGIACCTEAVSFSKVWILEVRDTLLLPSPTLLSIGLPGCLCTQRRSYKGIGKGKSERHKDEGQDENNSMETFESVARHGRRDTMHRISVFYGFVK